MGVEESRDQSDPSVTVFDVDVVLVRLPGC